MLNSYIMVWTMLEVPVFLFSVAAFFDYGQREICQFDHIHIFSMMWFNVIITNIVSIIKLYNVLLYCYLQCANPLLTLCLLLSLHVFIVVWDIILLSTGCEAILFYKMRQAGELHMIGIAIWLWLIYLLLTSIIELGGIIYLTKKPDTLEENEEKKELA